MFLDNHVKWYMYFYYYLIKTPTMLGYILPVATIFSTIYTIHRLVKTNEIVILFNSGLSFLRISVSLLVLAFCVSIFSFLLTETLVSPANYEISRLKTSIKTKSDAFRNDLSRTRITLRGKKGLFYDIALYDDTNKVISNVSIEKFEKNILMRTMYTFRTAEYTDRGWVAYDVYIKAFEDGVEVPVMITQPIPMLLLKISEKPSDFSKEAKTPREMNALELARFISERRRTGSDVAPYIVEYNMHFSFPMLPMLVALLGLSLCIKKPKIGFGSIVGYSLGIFFCFWGIFAVFKSLGISGKIPSSIAAWIPNIVIFAASTWIILSQQKKTFK